jgi:hypothetical protein
MGHNHNINIGNKSFAIVTVTGQNCIDKEIWSRLNLGNLYYYSVLNLVVQSSTYKCKDQNIQNCTLMYYCIWVVNFISHMMGELFSSDS